MEESTVIRRAKKTDLPRLLEVYATARQFMCRSGNPSQWAGSYPQEDLLREDVAAGRLYVIAEGDTICGCFMLCDGPDATYGQIFHGRWGHDAPYGVIHRVASDGTRKGVLSRCVAFARQRYPHLRIDTHEANLPMQRALTAAGFTHRGTILLEDGDPRLAYDWAESL